MPSPPSFLKGLRSLCARLDILLIFDEVQSGFGRTGKWFAQEHYDVIPDIMTVGKGIASGLPLRGFSLGMELMKKWPPGSHGGTYGGNPVAMAAGVATIRAIREEGMLKNAIDRGAQLMNGLKNLRVRFPQLVEVRGLGLMVGSEFTVKGGYRNVKPLVKSILNEAEKRGLLLLSAGTFDGTIRWIPPLNVSAAQIDEALNIFAESLREAVSQCKAVYE